MSVQWGERSVATSTAAPTRAKGFVRQKGLVIVLVSPPDGLYRVSWRPQIEGPGAAQVRLTGRPGKDSELIVGELDESTGTFSAEVAFEGISNGEIGVHFGSETGDPATLTGCRLTVSPVSADSDDNDTAATTEAADG